MPENEITVEGGNAVGVGGQTLAQRAESIRGTLRGLVADMEASHKHWQGSSGSSFNAAKQALFAKYNEIVGSAEAIARGLGASQTHITTGDTTSADAVSSAGAKVSALARPVNVNV
jgi:uncharacterized protein YukE